MTYLLKCSLLLLGEGSVGLLLIDVEFIWDTKLLYFAEIEENFRQCMLSLEIFSGSE